MNHANAAIEATLGHEGGYSDNPSDSGGETMWGITIAVARAYGYSGSMREMPRDEAKRIYLARYWHSQRLDQVADISFLVAKEIFDTGVNMGEAKGAQFFQRALNVLNMRGRWYADLAVDGRIGPMTVSAFREFINRRGQPGVLAMLKALNALQGAFYIELAERREKDEEFVFGWLTNRVAL